MDRKQIAPQHLEVQGNRGGSFISISRIDEETIHFRVGFDCVVVIDGVFKTNDLANFLSCKESEVNDLAEER